MSHLLQAAKAVVHIKACGSRNVPPENGGEGRECELAVCASLPPTS